MGESTGNRGTGRAELRTQQRLQLKRCKNDIRKKAFVEIMDMEEFR